MEMETENTKRVNQGANVRKFRQAMGMKQNTLAEQLGTTQQIVSRIEQRPVIEDKTLDRIAAILNISPEIIRNLEENPFSIVIENNTFESGSTNNSAGNIENNACIGEQILHPLDKIIELNKENTSLYERLLSIEKEKVVLLEKLVKEKK